MNHQLDTNAWSDLPSQISEWIAARDSRSLDQLITAYRPFLRALASDRIDGSIRARIDPSDIVQDTCIDFVRGSDRLQSANRFQLWNYFMAALQNKIRDTYRRNVLAQRRSVRREARNISSDALEKLACAAEQLPLEQLKHDETCQRVIRALLRRPSEMHRLLYWRFRKGMTFAEIGARLDRSENAIRMRFARFFAEIRKEVLDEEQVSM